MEEETSETTSITLPVAGAGADDAAAASLEMKHAAMIKRLNARHSTTTTPTPTTSSSTSDFLHRFSQTTASIHSRIQSLLPTPDVKPELDDISSSISDLETTLAQTSYLLPSYDVRASLKSIADLKNALEAASSRLIPRKKFSFRNATKLTKTIAVANDDVLSRRTTVSSSPSVAEGVGFRNKANAVLLKDFSDSRVSDFSLCDLSSCQVYLKSPFRALHVHHLRDCRVFVGPVLGSVLIEDVEGCIFVLASHQIRIHHAKACDFYLRVRSRPIIEDCNAVAFAPYRLHYEGLQQELVDFGLDEETGNWANVDDFRWLRAVQSPNWRVLPEHEREGTVDISDICAQED